MTQTRWFKSMSVQSSSDSVAFLKGEPKDQVVIVCKTNTNTNTNTNMVKHKEGLTLIKGITATASYVRHLMCDKRYCPVRTN